MLRLIFSLLAIEVAGVFFVLLVIRHNKHSHSLLEFLSLGFLVGTGVVTCQLFFYYMVGVPFSPSSLVVVPAVLFVLLLARYVPKPERLSGILLRSEKESHRRQRGLAWFLGAGLLIQLLWILFLTVPLPVISHDAVANYALKAKIFYFFKGVPAGFFSWSESTVAHPDYPPLLSFVMTWVHTFIGFNDFLVKMIMPVFYLAFMGLFYSLTRKFFNRVYALLLTFLLGTIPQLADYATIIHADLILTVFITCALIYFTLYLRTRNRINLILSSVLFGLSLWVKNEAIVFVAAFIVSGVVFASRSGSAWKKRIFTDVMISIIVVAVLSSSWFAVKLASAASNSDINIAQLTFGRLWQNIKDIPVLIYLFQQEVFGPKKWNIFWIIVFAGMIWKRNMLWKREGFYLMMFLILAGLGYFAGYMTTTGNNLFFYVNTTISRFMLHFSGISLFILAYLVYYDVNETMLYGTRRHEA